MEAQLTVEEGSSAGSMLSVHPGQTYTIGGGKAAQLVLRDPQIAERHTALRFEGDGLQVVDLGGPGGTLLNGERLHPRKPAEAMPGDTLTLGSHVVRITLLGRRARKKRRAPHRPIDPVVPQDEFELVRELGSGAAGKVYEATWKPHGRSVALKVLRETVQPDSVEFERFLRECRTVAQLNSPFVVGVYDIRVLGDRAFGILELVSGPSAHEVALRGPMEVPAALRVAEDVSQALEAAARAGVVHRDVKPSNIIISPEGRAKLCDFGIAKDLESTLRSLTGSGMGLGTLAYLPPEQVRDAKYVEPSADVYALGATLFQFIAGRPPFNPSTLESLDHILNTAAQPLTELRADCPPEVGALVRTMLDKNPDARPPLWKVTEAVRRAREQRYPEWDPRTLFGS